MRLWLITNQINYYYFVNYLLYSSKSEDDSPLIFLDDSDAEKDGDGEGESNQENRTDDDDHLTNPPSTAAIFIALILIHRNPLNISHLKFISFCQDTNLSLLQGLSRSCGHCALVGMMTQTYALIAFGCHHWWNRA